MLFRSQFGDPQSKTKPMDDPAMGTGGPGYTIKAEFITYGAQPHLDNNYTVFGKVTSGMEHVDRIRQGDRMTSITITEE